MAGLTRPVFGLDAPSETIVFGVMGTGGRGRSLARSLAGLPGAEVAYVCDADAGLSERAGAEVADIQEHQPEQVADFRRILDDDAVDALLIAASDHWHAPASILALSAGKHVYVEKPGSHNAREAELLVEAADASGRVVQMGNQRRSWPNLIEAFEKIRDGIIGRVYYSRGWYSSSRGPTHLAGPSDPPSHLDWELWQGPAPAVRFDESFHPYDWHWFWRWGTGEAGNIACHGLDLCRWGLEVDYPTRVSSHGGTYHYDDDWETPDTQVITLDFGDEKTVLWESRSRNNRPMEESGFGVSFHGEKGTVVIPGGNAYRVYDNDNTLVSEENSPSGFDIDYDHLMNFTDAIREGAALRSPIAEGQKSALLCHLGNIAYRSGQMLECDPETGRILNNDGVMRDYWGREYAPGWEPEA